MSDDISNEIPNITDLPQEMKVEFTERFYQKQKEMLERNDMIKRLIEKKIKHHSLNAEDRVSVDLSFEEMVFCCKKEAVCQIALHLHGTLNREALNFSFIKLVERHETLKTVFSFEESGMIRQYVGANWFDVKNVSPPSAEDHLQLIRDNLKIDREDISNFDAPLFRVTLLQCTEAHNILLISAHHIIFDGWSYDVMVNDLTQLYNATVAQQSSQLKPLSFQFSEYVAFQEKWLQSAEFDRVKAYWLKRFEGAATELNMPTERPRDISRGVVSGIQEIKLSEDITNKFWGLARECGATPFISLMSIMNIIVAHYSGQKDITIAYTNAGRFKPEHAGLIANFHNTMVYRHVADLMMSFREFVKAVRNEVFADQAHREIPFSLLKRAISQKSKKPYTNLLQVFVSTQPEAGRLALNGIEVVSESMMELLKSSEVFNERHPVVDHDDLIDLGLSCFGGQMIFFYNKDLYADEQIKRMTDLLQTLIEEVINKPDIPLEDLTALGN